MNNTNMNIDPIAANHIYRQLWEDLQECLWESNQHRAPRGEMHDHLQNLTTDLLEFFRLMRFPRFQTMIDCERLLTMIISDEVYESSGLRSSPTTVSQPYDTRPRSPSPPQYSPYSDDSNPFYTPPGSPSPSSPSHD
jgi:hypothetical protein